MSSIRKFFEEEEFLEVDTPTLVYFPDPSPFNEVFEVSNSKNEKYYLTPSPELCIKKLLSMGLKNVYQITKAYRDTQEINPLHLHEFTILEWYRTGGTYLDLMEDCENLILSTVENLAINFQFSIFNFQSKNQLLNYQNIQINLTKPWVRISCEEAFKKYTEIDLRKFLNIKYARKVAIQKGYCVNQNTKWEEIYHQLFLNEVEPKLPKDRPFFLYDYPAPLAALSKIKNDDTRFAERVELYIGGLELANGYSELTEWQEQEKRLKADLETRKEKGMRVFDYDHNFVEALKKGLPQTAGIAVGVDRLVMLLTDSLDIHEVSPFAI